MSMRRIVACLMAVACLAMVGCGSKHMEKVGAGYSFAPVADDESVIVFFRDSSYGGGIQADISEVVNDKLEYVAIVSTWTRYEHRTTPGEHTYLVSCLKGYSHLMDATLEGGKIYYCDLPIHMGFFTNSFTFVPITDEEIAAGKKTKDIYKCDLVVNKPSAQYWFQGNLPSLYNGFAAAKNERRAVMPPHYGVRMPVQASAAGR